MTLLRDRPVSDPASRTTAFEYDADHNLTKTTSPDTTIISRTYTADDLLASLTGPSVLYSYTYGPTHLLTHVSDQADRAFDFTYNPAGWLTNVFDNLKVDHLGAFRSPKS